MKSLYLSIAKRLREACPFLRTIDLDRGQLQGVLYGESTRPEVAYPALLLRLSIDRTTDLTPTLQECEVTVSVTFATDQTTETAEHMDPARQMAGLRPLEQVEQVYRALQDWDDGGAVAPLSRSSEEPLELRRGLFAERIVYRTTYQDLTAYDAD